MELYNTISNALIRFDRHMKREIINDESPWTILEFSFIPIYGPYLINHKLNDLKDQIENPLTDNKVRLIEEYEDTAYILVAACAVQALFLSIIPVVILSSQFVLALAQFTVGMGMIYGCAKIETQVNDYRNRYDINQQPT